MSPSISLPGSCFGTETSPEDEHVTSGTDTDHKSVHCNSTKTSTKVLFCFVDKLRNILGQTIQNKTLKLLKTYYWMDEI